MKKIKKMLTGLRVLGLYMMIVTTFYALVVTSMLLWIWGYHYLAPLPIITAFAGAMMGEQKMVAESWLFKNSGLVAEKEEKSGK